MSQISVSGLTFGYEGALENVFTNVSFSFDTDWKLGLIGRNGKGKTTFLKLLLGEYEYRGAISSSARMEYFPYKIPEEWMGLPGTEICQRLSAETEDWQILKELSQLDADGELLYRPWETLSHGERTKVMLALLFAKESGRPGDFYPLIDEPTSHLDAGARESVKNYLQGKRGFLLVSHDRWLLDACTDHILALNRSDIQVCRGNFTAWWENKEKQDAFERRENERLEGQISRLSAAAGRTGAWADQAEDRKIGYDPIKERGRPGRDYFGEKSRKMQQQRKNLERRRLQSIEEKKGLLHNLEEPDELKLFPLRHYKEQYLYAKDLDIFYGAAPDDAVCVLKNIQMTVSAGDRILLRGKNGSGKSSLIKAILGLPEVEVLDAGRSAAGRSEWRGNREDAAGRSEWRGNQEDAAERSESKESRGELGGPWIRGELHGAPKLLISYVSQDTSFLKGSLADYIHGLGIDQALFMGMLRRLNFEREQFAARPSGGGKGKKSSLSPDMEEFSEGQKKKVLLAASLLQKAHLYIWDEPLNYVDVFSRMQIEDLILKYKPTMLFVEHDRAFGDKIATRVMEL